MGLTLETPKSTGHVARSTRHAGLSLVERLRTQGCAELVKDEAAAEIERLTRALDQIANGVWHDGMAHEYKNIARAALGLEQV